MTQLADFIVFKSIAVRNLVVKPKRVSATYEIVFKDDTKISNVLFYTYNDPLFDKSNLEDLNLASMMVSQVAVNYGLFCEKLIFEGHFEACDQQFIRQMVENTSREILTNKLLIENPFLISPYDQLKPEQRDTYTQADIVFPLPTTKIKKESVASSNPDYSQYAILSSGGKDSLLSYGLLKELGQPHPIFVNEAGRHWFTAVNAYRYFKDIEPNTGKAWCNSDRIFNWFVKNMPFIKPNYASIRADIYPIRLWTVAVFLFGVLPIARKKGLGNIIIGNEYDTTEKKNKNGITHYAALYDQSKYFDNALTRYYSKKNWNLYQFSLLRSMSELLIMKVLLHRYPEHQKQQISCHAAHEQDKRMYPCGKCEKCRRIIGMVKALGGDPRACGYTEDQIARGLHNLSNKGVKQIGSDAAHLYHLLVRESVIERNEFTIKLAREYPEVMKLRFDAERSNLEDMPGSIRVPLFKILSEYSDGAVIRIEKDWQPLELNHDFLNKSTYKYERK